LHFNTKLTFYKFATQYTIYNQSLKAIEECKSRVYKPYIDANKTNTLIFATATALATTITITLLITPYINTFLTLLKFIYQNPLR
jgi:hypothetical protein